ncbi:MAG: hypothetical protein ABSG92_06275 [Conexivisphaerales archaeon]|jgi:hypothetical protein
MSSEANATAEESKKAQEFPAFLEAKEAIRSKAKEFAADAESQLAELKKRTVESFEGL